MGKASVVDVTSNARSNARRYFPAELKCARGCTASSQIRWIVNGGFLDKARWSIGLLDRRKATHPSNSCNSLQILSFIFFASSSVSTVFARPCALYSFRMNWFSSRNGNGGNLIPELVASVPGDSVVAVDADSGDCVGGSAGPIGASGRGGGGGPVMYVSIFYSRLDLLNRRVVVHDIPH